MAEKGRTKGPEIAAATVSGAGVKRENGETLCACTQCPSGQTKTRRRLSLNYEPNNTSHHTGDVNERDGLRRCRARRARAGHRLLHTGKKSVRPADKCLVWALLAYAPCAPSSLCNRPHRNVSRSCLSRPECSHTRRAFLLLGCRSANAWGHHTQPKVKAEGMRSNRKSHTCSCAYTLWLCTPYDHTAAGETAAALLCSRTPMGRTASWELRHSLSAPAPTLTSLLTPSWAVLSALLTLPPG